MTISNRLTVLAAEIQQAHEDVRVAAATAARRAVDAGHALIEAKAVLPHGAWLPWLKENTALSPRVAQGYMRLARLGLKSETVSHLGIRAALDLVAEERPRPTDDEWVEFADSTRVNMTVINEGRFIALAERLEPGIVRRALDDMLERREEPTHEKLRAELLATVQRAALALPEAD